MWTETFHRFDSEAAFLAACDAAGWPRGPDNTPQPPAGVSLDVVGSAVQAPTLVGTVITPGAVDPRWHVNAAWFSGTSMPSGFAAAEVIPERPVRTFAARDPGQKAAAVKAVFEARKLAKPDDPRLVAAETVMKEAEPSTAPEVSASSP
jgi:hypothetical protein